MTDFITRAVFFVIFPVCLIALVVTYLIVGGFDDDVIAYVGFDDNGTSAVIRMIDLDTRINISLTSNFRAAVNPQWSPDGEHLLFIADFGQYQQIAVIDADGSNGRYISPPNPRNQPYIEPRWVSDGEQIAYNTVEGVSRAVYVLDTLIYNLPERLDNDSPILQDYLDQIALNNGQFPASDDNQSSLSLELIGSRWGIVLDGQNGRQVLHYISRFAVQLGSVLIVSPSGERIVFADEVNGILELFVMNVDGGNLRRLTSGSGVEPVWRP